jgi:hypothetical protein
MTLKGKKLYPKDIHGIRGFAMTYKGLVTFTMTYKELTKKNYVTLSLLQSDLSLVKDLLFAAISF